MSATAMLQQLTRMTSFSPPLAAAIFVTIVIGGLNPALKRGAFFLTFAEA